MSTEVSGPVAFGHARCPVTLAPEVPPDAPIGRCPTGAADTGGAGVEGSLYPVPIRINQAVTMTLKFVILMDTNEVQAFDAPSWRERGR